MMITVVVGVCVGRSERNRVQTRLNGACLKFGKKHGRIRVVHSNVNEYDVQAPCACNSSSMRCTRALAPQRSYASRANTRNGIDVCE
jgi:hypothetical protein